MGGVPGIFGVTVTISLNIDVLARSGQSLFTKLPVFYCFPRVKVRQASGVYVPVFPDLLRLCGAAKIVFLRAFVLVIRRSSVTAFISW